MILAKERRRYVAPDDDEVSDEEVVDAETAPVQRGKVRVVRRVETIPVAETVQTWQEVVDVERVPVNREIEAAPEPRTEGDVIVIPVVEEIVVTETRLGIPLGGGMLATPQVIAAASRPTTTASCPM